MCVYLYIYVYIYIYIYIYIDIHIHVMIILLIIIILVIMLITTAMLIITNDIYDVLVLSLFAPLLGRHDKILTQRRCV